ncbi:mechanosensitive ion channel [Pseudanabaena sp. FACHB-1998]|uniref:mechanosensitive ion channel n=1 Tax=Pseudanabaena sp. FACHB-1998 TaxID=2692858 RepID=UPI0016800D51|nr:mechanosensitive ion channel [Pseudanabaena sp. FACHB-1998]MBD2177142.1 mechanosensitive ion channel [Pseudanabaena sp. FACHB-1998]
MPQFTSFLLAQTSTTKSFAIEDLLRPDGLVFQIIFAVLILVGGWIIAIFFASMTENLLKKTSIDNKLAGWLTGSTNNTDTFPIEKWASATVFWIILLFTLVGFFQYLKLDAVATPLNGLLGQITSFLPKLGGAAILVGIAWVLATISKMIVGRFLRSANIDAKVNESVSDSPTESLPLSETLSSALYWFILLLFLPLVLDTLGLVQALQPVQNLVNQILSALPKILKAVMIGGIGWLIAQVVKRITTNLLATSGADRFLNRWTSNQTEYTLSQVIGNFVYILILIPTAISTLEALEIGAISRPATTMLDQVLRFLPQVFVATVIVVVAYFLGQFVRDIVSSILTGLGFNNILQLLGFNQIAVTTQTDALYENPDSNVNTSLPPQTPSQIVGIIVFLAIMLVAIATATDVLQINALTRIVFGVLQVAGQVLSGVVIFGIGLYLANLAFNLIASTGGRQARILGHAARISIVALITAMALKQMGIASNIVDLAFGLLTGAIAVAIAVAFGLGGKDIASQQLREWLESFKRND